MGSRSTDSASAAEGPRVGIVTVVYRSDDVLPAFLASVPSASREPTALVVVDNSASADSASSGRALDEGPVRRVAQPVVAGVDDDRVLGQS